MIKNTLTVLFVILAALVANFTYFTNRSPQPPHLFNHTLIDKENFLSPEIVDALLANTRKSTPIWSTTKEPAIFTTIEDNIGEATDVIVDAKTGAKSCPHKLLVVDNSGKKCIMPGRIDVGRHYLVTGGIEAKKEAREILIARIQGFLHYILDYKNDPVTKRLLEEPKMVELAAAICPKHKPYVNPFQFNYVVQVPGQTVAAHIDGVYFRKASRFHVPQWLLAAMKFSGLFEDDFVDQVQVVAYYHKWWSDDRAGNFFFWNDPKSQTPQISRPISRSANAVDGTKTIHAAGVYMPWRLPPALPRVGRNTLEYRPGDKTKGEAEHTWEVKSDGKVIATYPEDDLRFSAVYRCRCFKSEADYKQFELDQKAENAWNTTFIMNIFRKDLDKRGILAETAKIDTIKLIELMLATYIKYPLSPDAVIPYNVCAVTELESLEFLKPVMSLFC